MTQVDLDLIGRQREQAELDQALAATHHGTGGIVLLAGEAGVGKTRLLEACLAHSGLLALKAQTNEIATPPYGPIAAALRAYLRARPGGAFRHALTREAIYGDISWGRRRALHRQMAERLQAAGAAPLAIAQHWLAAKEPDRARAALLAAAAQAGTIHAYRDAADAAQRALELWPDGAEDARRLDVLDQLGQSAQLCGMLSEAARAWREVADGRRQTGDLRACAVTERKLANVAELQGHWDRALAAREAAAQAFAASKLPAESAAERLSAAAHLRSAGRYRAALELLSTATEEAAQAGRPDLHARIMGLEGNVRARMGQVPDGLALVQSGLALALEQNLASAAAEIYQRDGTIIVCGNGGSAATASHFACDLLKWTVAADRRRLRALALTDNVPVMTAWSNDTSYESLFVEQLISHYRPGDLLFAISGSGNSPNVIQVVAWARQQGAPTVGLSGFDGGKLAQLARHSLCVDNHAMPQVEDAHSAVCHALAVWLGTRLDQSAEL